MDPETDEDVKEDVDEDQPDVKDPHIGSDQRRRDMEAEMNEDERQDLRGGWEDFVKSEPSESGPSRPPKRPFEPDASPRPAKAAKDKSTSNFGSGMVERERLKGLGMVQTTLSNTANTVGSRSTAVTAIGETEVKPWVLEDSQWECKLCTYVNIADHGRCGRQTTFSMRDKLKEQKFVKLDPMGRCLQESLSRFICMIAYRPVWNAQFIAGATGFPGKRRRVKMWGRIIYN